MVKRRDIMRAIVNGKILFAEQVIENKALLFEEQIKGIVDVNEVPEGCEVIDAKGNFIYIQNSFYLDRKSTRLNSSNH